MEMGAGSQAERSCPTKRGVGSEAEMALMGAELTKSVQLVWARIATPFATIPNYNRGPLAKPESHRGEAIQSSNCNPINSTESSV